MKSILKFVASVVLLLGATYNSFAQFTLSGEYRPRAEYRHGFQALPNENQPDAFFIDQRTRINLDYMSEKYDVKIVLQDVRVWGSQSQLVVADGATTTIHEAWGSVKFNSWLSAKLGRQEIIYDDHRIFGNVGWAQQARSHDAAIFRIKPEGVTVDVGMAYNQNGATNSGNYYSVAKSYKDFFYIWAHKDFNKVKASLLYLNLGNQGGVPPANFTYRQSTLGGRFSFKNESLAANAAVYSQFGETSNEDISLRGLLYSADVAYTLSKKHTLVLGYEHISGNDEVDGDADKNTAFNPYFGTNHKFNGLMDYFYVGNHLNNVGLNDLYFGYKPRITDKFDLGAVVHLFSSDGEISDPADASGATAMDKSLGTELDITGSFKLSKEVGFAFGYSQMFGTESMVELKGTGDINETANWAWLMVTFKPTFFTTKEKDKE